VLDLLRQGLVEPFGGLEREGLAVAEGRVRLAPRFVPQPVGDPGVVARRRPHALHRFGPVAERQGAQPAVDRVDLAPELLEPRAQFGASPLRIEDVDDLGDVGARLARRRSRRDAREQAVDLGVAQLGTADLGRVACVAEQAGGQQGLVPGVAGAARERPLYAAQHPVVRLEGDGIADVPDDRLGVFERQLERELVGIERGRVDAVPGALDRVEQRLERRFDLVDVDGGVLREGHAAGRTEDQAQHDGDLDQARPEGGEGRNETAGRGTGRHGSAPPGRATRTGSRRPLYGSPGPRRTPAHTGARTARCRYVRATSPAAPASRR